MAVGVRKIASLPDPVGEIIRDWTRPNGLRIQKVRVPIGVVGIIYESRPNVTSDAAVLCTKTGNATILRGGRESIHSNVAIAKALSAGGAEAGLPADAIVLIPQTEFDATKLLALLQELANDPARLSRMAASARAEGKPMAVTAIADALEQESGSVQK